MKPTVCVVGAGLAGGIIASQLARAGYAVTLVEQGVKAVPLLAGDEDWTSAVPKAVFTRGMGLGGTSNFWHGGLTPLDPTDTDSPEPEGPRRKGPIPYGELKEYYERAIAVMRGDQGYSLADILTRPDPAGSEFVIDDELFTYKGLLYPKVPFSSREAIAVGVKRYGMRVERGLNVRRVVFAEPAKATCVEGRLVGSGGTRRIEADVYVLSAGGIGSPRILLESAVGNGRLRALPIGKYLIDHPTGFVFKAKLRRAMYLKDLCAGPRDGYRMQYGLVLRPDRLHLAGGRNHVVYLRPALSMKDPAEFDVLKRRLVACKGRSLSPMDVAYLLRHGDLLFDALNFKFGLYHSTRYVAGLAFAEQFPDDSWGVKSLASGRFEVKWGISENDRRSLEEFVSMLVSAHSGVFESVDQYASLEERLDTACHHSGGCRMGYGPEDGVVDDAMRVFGTDNLFVCDGSVIRFAGCANTGLTIGALAMKCCDSIRRDFA